MKKNLFISVFLVITVFCVGLINANASTLNAYFDLAETDYFNVFREFNEQTAMSKFLVSHGNNILDYLKSYGYELTKENSVTSSSGRTPNSVLIRKNIMDNSYRIYILFLNNITINASSYSYEVGSWSRGYEFIYDKDMNLQKCNYINLDGNSDLKTELLEKLSVLGFWGEGDLTELYSTLYYTLEEAININSDYDKINLSYVQQSNKFYRFESYKWKDYMSFGSLLQGSIILPNQFDFSSNFDLKWYKENPVKNGPNDRFKSLCSVLFKEDTIEIPDGYESFTINSSNVLYYLTYRGNLEADSNIYYYGNFSDVEFYGTNYKVQENLIKGKDFKFKVNNPYSIYSINPSQLFELESLVGNSFMFYQTEDKYSKTIYYDPEAYHFNLRYVGSSDDLVLTNNDGSHRYTASQVQRAYNQSINSSKEDFDSEDNKNNDSSGGFEFGVDTVLSGFKNFINSVGALCTSLGVFLADLPPALSGLLYSGVTMGIIAMIIKIIL